MNQGQPATRPRVWEANRLGLDYRAEAERLGAPVRPIIDVHTHINGERAAEVFGEVMRGFGVAGTWSQTQYANAHQVKRVLGDAVEFIAIPEYMAEDKERMFREDFLENIRRFHGEFGAKIVKFWSAPRLRDMRDPVRDADVIMLDGAWRVRAAELAQTLGMMFMVHVADPDTWFSTKYTDSAKYGTKCSHYEPLERMADRFEGPWLAAHMGGWPEDLDFLDALLSRHDNLYLDTSATKWQVRELSRHPRERFVEFFTRWRGRLLFGTDIVTSDEHLRESSPDEARFRALLASNREEAFELYASRMWALRTMFETSYDGESPIADPDLAMVDPGRHDAMSAPRLVGRSLDRETLLSLYGGAAEAMIAKVE